jgi:hypothetical protein
MELHNRLTRFFLGGQFVQSLGHLVGDVLHHIDFVACPGASVIALLQNHTTMRANLTAKRNA